MLMETSDTVCSKSLAGLTGLRQHWFQTQPSRAVTKFAWLPCSVVYISLLALCGVGCSPNEDALSRAPVPSLVSSTFASSGDPSCCAVQCIHTTLTMARAELRLDPTKSESQPHSDLDAVLDSLVQQGEDIGSTIARVPVEEVLDDLSEGPNRPSVLVHSTGHLYILLGTIRVSDRLLCQVVHGKSPISLVSPQVLKDEAFRKAWKFVRSEDAWVPLRVGSTMIEIDRLWHNYGEVLPDSNLECTFHLRNTGNVAVVLDRPFTSCNCTVPHMQDKTELRPGSVLDVTLRTKPPNSPSLRQPILLTLYERGTGTPRHVTLEVLGTHQKPMEIIPPHVDFGEVIPGHAYSRTVRLVEFPTDRFALKSVDVGALPLTYTVEKTNSPHGLRTYRVHLQLVPHQEDTVGRHGSEIVLIPDGQTSTPVTIPVLYAVVSSVTVVPSAVAFGTLNVGEPSERKVTFVSREGNSLTVHECHVPNGCVAEVTYGFDGPELILRLQLDKPGIWEGVIRARVGSSLRHDRWFDIKCAAYGRAMP